MCQIKRIPDVVSNKVTRKLFVSIESLKHSHNHVGNWFFGLGPWYHL